MHFDDASLRIFLTWTLWKFKYWKSNTFCGVLLLCCTNICYFCSGQKSMKNRTRGNWFLILYIANHFLKLQELMLANLFICFFFFCVLCFVCVFFLFSLNKMFVLFQYLLDASFLEIYNETIRDLLGDGRDDVKHDIKMSGQKNSNEVFVTNLTIVRVTEEEMVSRRRKELLFFLWNEITMIWCVLAGKKFDPIPKSSLEISGQFYWKS